MTCARRERNGPEKRKKEDTAATLPAKMARQSTHNLLDVLTAIREKLVPCPHKDCSGSTNQFYSFHGLEQHWRRFHHRPSNHFSQDGVFMGQSLLKKIHFELVKEVLNEKFKTWSEREQVIMCLQ